jgi:hypothetical protein
MFGLVGRLLAGRRLRPSSAAVGLNAESPVWRQYSATTNDYEHVERVFCVGSALKSSRIVTMCETLCSYGISVDLCTDFQASLASIAEQPTEWALLIVDVDVVEKYLGLTEVVDELISFREACPSLSVVLLSYSFGADDPDLVRSAIADYCFNSSRSDFFVISSLSDVFRNHEAWLRRNEARDCSVRSQSSTTNVSPFPIARIRK